MSLFVHSAGGDRVCPGSAVLTRSGEARAGKVPASPGGDIGQIERTLVTMTDQIEAVSPPPGERGAATAEYAIATMAAVGFAGLLVVIMQSDEVRQILTDLVRSALSFSA